MARPSKVGLDYFPLDVDFFDSEILNGITGEFGIKGELITIKLLCTVYKKGYFAVWNDLLQAQIAKKANVTKDLAIQVVDRLVTWGFFDKSLYDSAKVLTSAEIQEVYFEATKRRKTAKPTEYLVNVNNNYSSNEVNVNINAQSKVKETKVNKSKVNTNPINTDKNYIEQPENEDDPNFVDGIELPFKLEPKKPVQELAVGGALDFFEQNGFGAITQYNIQKVNGWVEDFKQDGSSEAEEIVIKAMQVALNHNVRNFSYANAILNRWSDNKLLSISAIEESDEKHQQTLKGDNDNDPRNKGLAPDDPNYRPGRGNYTNAELQALKERVGF